MRNAIASAALILVFSCTTLLADDPSVLFSDDFSTLDPAWGNDSTMSVAGGKMVIKPAANGFGTPLYQGTTFNDVDMSVKITQTGGTPGGGEAGLVFWANDFSNYYMLAIKTDGNFAVPRDMNDKFLHPIPWQPNDVVKKGLNQVNEVRVITKGKTAMAYINGTQVANFKGFPADGGTQAGLHAESFDQAATWAFSDFVVRKPQ